MPDSLELPRMRRAVVPLVRGEWLAGFGRRVVNKLVALALRHAVRGGGRLAGGCSGLVPCLAAIIRALHDLPKPAARLRRIQPVWIRGRSLEVIHLPAREMGAAHLPLFALSVRCQDERSLACSNQYPYSAHNILLPSFVVFVQTFSKTVFNLYGSIPAAAACRAIIQSARGIYYSAGRPVISFTGRTSTVPMRAPGTREAIPIASLRSLASIRK